MLFKKVLVVFKYFRGHSPKRRNHSSLNNTWNSLFEKHLLLTNTVTCGGLMFLGDLIQQEIEYQDNKLPERYDYDRLTRMFTIGVPFGPLHHYVYGWMQKMWPEKNLKAVGKKILFDQLAMSPVCILLFFYGAGVLEKRTLKQINEEVSHKFLEVYTVDWSVWPPIQFINFYFLPVKYQVLFVNTVTMCYNVFLSYVKHREVAQEYAAKAADASLNVITDA